MTTAIDTGRKVVITDAMGNESEAVALSGVETEGHAFPVVWIERPMRDGATEPAPWPAEYVRPL
jgi:hypothetical protein